MFRCSVSLRYKKVPVETESSLSRGGTNVIGSCCCKDGFSYWKKR